MPKRRRKVRDKWKLKSWYTVYAPPYFGGKEIGHTPADDPNKVLGRVLETTLGSITDDLSQDYLKLYFQVVNVDGDRAETMFKGHEYMRDFLRSLVRRRTSRIDGIFDVATKDGYRLRVYAVAFTYKRIKTSQKRAVRQIMGKIIAEKSKELNFEQFVHEMVLGKMASDIYNEAKKIILPRHVGVYKSKVLKVPVKPD